MSEYVFVIHDQRLVKATVIKRQKSGNVKCVVRLPSCSAEIITFKPDRYVLPNTSTAVGETIRGKLYFSNTEVPDDERFWGKNDVDLVERYWEISGRNGG